VRRNREFIEDGFNMGRHEDLTGGGLRRSAGGREGVLEGIGPVLQKRVFQNKGTNPGLVNIYAFNAV
jgi:hypothetical protein